MPSLTATPSKARFFFCLFGFVVVVAAVFKPDSESSLFKDVTKWSPPLTSALQRGYSPDLGLHFLPPELPQSSLCYSPHTHTLQISHSLQTWERKKKDILLNVDLLQWHFKGLRVQFKVMPWPARLDLISTVFVFSPDTCHGRPHSLHNASVIVVFSVPFKGRKRAPTLQTLYSGCILLGSLLLQKDPCLTGVLSVVLFTLDYTI